MVVDGRHHLQRQRIAAVSTRSEYRIANRSILFSQVVDDYMYYLTERARLDRQMSLMAAKHDFWHGIFKL